MLSRPFQTGDLITWRQGPGIFVQPIPPFLQLIPNFAKTPTSHDAHFIVIILCTFPSRKRLYMHNDGQQHFLQEATKRVRNIEFHWHIGGDPEGVALGKRGVFCIRGLFYGKTPGRSGLSQGDNLGQVWRTRLFCCFWEIDDGGETPSWAGVAINDLFRLGFWHHSPE